jgi:transposase
MKFREKVMEFMQKGHSIKETHEIFGIGTTTIKGWKKLLKETGSLEKRPLNRSHKKIDPDQLRNYVAEKPDSYLSEIAAVFNCTETAVFYALKCLKITRKKTISYVERNDELRTNFIESIASYPQYKLYYVDESGLDQYLYREYRRAPAGISVTGKLKGKKFKRTNIVAAKCGDKIIAPFTYSGMTDSILFEHWFEKMLLKSMPKYSVIVLDNASFL